MNNPPSPIQSSNAACTLDSRLPWSRLLMYASPLLLGGVIRTILFVSWLNSPARYFHTIGGLDMIKLLEKGRRFAQGEGAVTLYNLFLTTVLKLVGEASYADAVVVAQLVLGLTTALLVTNICLRLSGNRIVAAAAGCIMAGYAPALLYEVVHLRESFFLFVCTLAFWVFLICLDRSFRAGWPILTGAIALLPPLVRLSGLMWTVMAGLWLVIHALMTNTKAGRADVAFWKQFHAKSCRATCITALLYIAGLAITALPVSVYTKAVTGKFLPSHTNITYALNVGKQGIPSELKTDSGNESGPTQDPSVIKVFTTYGEKIVALFHPFEITNNLNYYFMKHLLAPLKFCVQPLLIIPLAVLGLVLIPFMPRGLQRYSPLYLYIVAHMIPLALFVPLSRYRLILIPAFVIAALIPFLFVYHDFCAAHKQRKLRSLVLLGAYSILLTVSIPKSAPIRPSDFVNVGIALEHSKKEVDPKRIESFYRMSLKLAPDYFPAAGNLSNLLSRQGHFKEAKSLLAPFYDAAPGNVTISTAYSTALLGSNAPEQAYNVLDRFRNDKNATARFDYWYNLAEAARMLEKNGEARGCYQHALQTATRPGQKRRIKAQLKRLGATEASKQ